MPIDPEVKKALDLRLAKGEITPEEYRQRFALLEDTTPTPPPTPDPGMGDEYTLSTHEAAQAIGVTRGTLQGYIASGRLHTNPNGTIDTAALRQAGFIIRDLPHTEFTPQTAQNWTKAKPQKARSSRNVGIGCLLLIVIFVIAMILGQPTPGQKAKERAEGSPGMAAIMCQDFVKKRLKAPSSAKFPNAFGEDTKTVTLGTGHYLVTSYVDAQNSFGAQMRTSFVCEIKKIPGGDEWQLQNLSM